ncbi:Hypothetical protein NTJ_06938 [Nesidiocoris tenuis]|uniref:Uncharacterized protein n=1 Tax=Nesidiocoris tenuis TaxID=355587 RepID=A0ABN7ARP5_9HEMI|nr:Hypothetical protein NTJ_06938 [Nesidiocoris tenuis]
MTVVVDPRALQCRPKLLIIGFLGLQITTAAAAADKSPKTKAGITGPVVFLVSPCFLILLIVSYSILLLRIKISAFPQGEEVLTQLCIGKSMVFSAYLPKFNLMFAGTD